MEETNGTITIHVVESQVLNSGIFRLERHQPAYTGMVTYRITYEHEPKGERSASKDMRIWFGDHMGRPPWGRKIPEGKLPPPDLMIELDLGKPTITKPGIYDVPYRTLSPAEALDLLVEVETCTEKTSSKKDKVERGAP